MPHAPAGKERRYLTALGGLLWAGTTRLLKAPSHSRRAQARRRWARHSLVLSVGVAAAIIALMYMLDASVIGAMPARGSAALWPLRIITDFGKAAYVIDTLAALLVISVLVAPALRDRARLLWIGAAIRLQYLLLAVLVPVGIGEIIKGVIGRGRPFVGGAANAFNYSHFAWSEAYASFPSGHANTSAALAFAVSALWPRLTPLMIVYACMIAVSRVVLLAHHPSDVVAGALLGVIGAMVVRYWFAARRLGFKIGADGGIAPLRQPALRLYFLSAARVRSIAATPRASS